jgi:DNA-binding NtrC family response regulator
MPTVPTVLLVDDDVMLLDAVKDTLEPLAVRIETRESAEEAMAWLQAGGAPALIISNQWMIGMTGQALFQWVARHKPGVRCVLHTGDSAQRGDENVTVIIKPTAPGILKNMVSAICGKA